MVLSMNNANTAHAANNTPDITDLTIDGILTVDIIHFDRTLDRITTRREHFVVRDNSTVYGVCTLTLAPFHFCADKVYLTKYIVSELSGLAVKDIAGVTVGTYRAI